MTGFTAPVQAQVEAADVASVLIEALPYMQRFRGESIVVKLGGSALVDPVTADGFAADIALMRMVGINPIVVHGGGPQITAMMSRLGKEAVFRDGQRITDSDSLEITRMVLVGTVNRDIVNRINEHGAMALGISGEDSGLIVAAQRNPELGLVGDVAAVDPDLINRLVAEGLIPVIATLGADSSGQAYNINADAVASAVASELGALKLIYLTDVEGLYRDPSDDSTLVQETTDVGLREAMAAGWVTAGMTPKVEGSLAALSRGVSSVHIIGSSRPHGILVELFTDSGMGTMIKKAGSR